MTTSESVLCSIMVRRNNEVDKEGKDKMGMQIARYACGHEVDMGSLVNDIDEFVPGGGSCPVCGVFDEDELVDEACDVAVEAVMTLLQFYGVEEREVATRFAPVYAAVDRVVRRKVVDARSRREAEVL